MEVVTTIAIFVFTFLGHAVTIFIPAWFAGRLLGATHLSWKTSLLAGIIG